MANRAERRGREFWVRVVRDFEASSQTQREFCEIWRYNDLYVEDGVSYVDRGGDSHSVLRLRSDGDWERLGGTGTLSIPSGGFLWDKHFLFYQRRAYVIFNDGNFPNLYVRVFEER